MKAVLMTAVGAPEVLQLAELPDPGAPGPRQLRVRVRAAGVNPVDTKLRARGTYYPDRMPAVLGCDGAGVVEAVGAEVTRFRPGDEVYYCHGGIGGQPGNYAQVALVDEAVVAHKPPQLSFEEAAALPLVLITAWESLHDRAGLAPGRTVLIHAGAGGVGHVAIQLARAAGCRVMTTVGGKEKADFVRALGAEDVIDYRQKDFVQAVLHLTGGEGADVAFDTVGGEVFQRSFAAVRPYGDIVTLLQPGPDVDWKIPRLRNQRTSLELMLSPMYFGWQAALRHQGEILAKGAELVEQGQLRVHLSNVLPLAQAAEAHRRIEAGGMMGKLVLQVE
ncbi:MAG: zinc-dependent alcohol dehydrogenase family protein [Thiohalomonadaceae bacterium]